MFCKNCGNLISESDKFCPGCGAETHQQTVDNSVPQTAGQNFNQINSQVLQKPLGMKWYKFIIYVQLFLSMAAFVYTGIRYIDGSILGTKEQVETIYTVFPSFKSLNIVYGIVQFLFIAFLAVIWYRMFKFKKNAPTLYILNFLIQIILEWVWLIIAITNTGLGFDAFSSTIYGTIGRNFGWLIYMASNASYFKKRKFMFIN